MLIGVLVAYMILLLSVSIYLRKNVQGFEDFMVAGRKAGLVLVTASFIASHFGGGMVIGGSEYGILYGLGGAWYGIGCGISYLAFGLVMSRKVYRMKLMTIPDFLAERYRSRKLRTVMAFLGVLAVISLLGSQVLAASYIFKIFGLPILGGVVLAVVIFIAYSAISGMWGIMGTDVIQVIIGFVGVALATFIGLSRIGGWEGLVSSVPTARLSLTSLDTSILLTFIVPPALAGFVSQPSFQRVSSSKSEKVAFNSCLIAGIILIIFAFVPVLGGMVSQVMLPGVPAGQAILSMILELFPLWLGSIFVAALLAAIMSTADGVLLAGVAHAVRDFYQKTFRPEAPERSLMKASYLATALIGLGAMGLALYFETIIELLLLAYALMVSAGLIPILGGMFWKRGNEKGALFGIIAGALFTILSVAGVIPLPYYLGIIPCLFFYMFFSLLGKTDNPEGANFDQKGRGV